MSEQVIVLNASYEPHQSVPLNHALKMLCRGVAVVEEAIEGRMAGPYPIPKVLRLIRYVYIKTFKKGAYPRYSRSGVLRRDKHMCMYRCGRTATTIDHIVPVSRGGASSWLNVVAACLTCNAKKSNKMLKDTGMKLAYQPFVPTFFQMHT